MGLHMSQRFFRASAATYESVRSQLDAAWGLPNDKGTHTCAEPAATAPHDAQGRVLLAVRPKFCEFEAVAAVLPLLLSSGSVQEITEAEYWAAFPQSDAT